MIALLLAAGVLAIAPPEQATTVAQRQAVNVTVYNGGTASIHDRRVMKRQDGLNHIAWRDVSANMDPTSALLETVGSTNNVTVREQNFDFDLLDPGALLQKYAGKYVTVVHDARFAGERETRRASPDSEYEWRHRLTVPRSHRNGGARSHYLGVVRIYKTDSSNVSQFVGSDQIDHTPKNETVRLTWVTRSM
jgi:hypothetical protein